MFSTWLTTARNHLVVPAVILILALVGLPAAISSYALGTYISPATLTNTPAYVGQAYHQSLSFGGGATWSVTSGELPSGLVLASGSISGVPTQPGEYTFAVRALALDGSTATNTYSMFVYPAAATGYAIRTNSLIQVFFNHPWPPLTGCTDHLGYLNYATAALWLNEDVANANSKLSAVQISHVDGQNCSPSEDVSSSNLWLGYLLRPYLLYNTQSSYFPGRMSAAAQSNLVAQMWAYANPYSVLSQAADPWLMYNSENHEAQGKSFNFLAAQVFMNTPGYQTKTYRDGSTVAQQYNAWHDYWSRYFDERAKKGLFIEVASPTYHGYTVQAILNIYNFAQDPVLRKKAGMILDLDFADFAQTQLHNISGGPASRSYPLDSYGDSDSMTQFADLLYGPMPIPATTAQVGNHVLALATSGYNPPAVVGSLMADRFGKGSYEYIARRPGAGPLGSSGGVQHLDITKSVLDYSYTTPDYVMGTAELNPAGSYIGPSCQNRWQGIIFNTGPTDRVYPQPVLSSYAGGWPCDAYASVQDQNVLITNKKDAVQPSLVYFPSSLKVLNEQNGWLFVQDGSAYLAVRPQNGYAWLTTAKNKAANINNRFIELAHASSRIIFEAARASQYTSFAAFKSDILNNQLTYSSGVVHYTSSNGTQFSWSVGSNSYLVNGLPTNYSPTDVFNSPSMKSAWNSGKITITHNSFSATYDFSDAAHPVKLAN